MNPPPTTPNIPQGTIRTKNTPYETAGKQHPEGTTYHINHGIHELALFHRNPTAAEKNRFSNAPAQMALWNNPPVLWIAVKFGALDWIDTPYTVHLTHPDARTIPELESPEERYPLTMLYVNADGGDIEAIRVATMSPAMSRDIRRISQEQEAEKYDPENYERSLRTTMEQYAPRQIARLAQRLETLGQNGR